jgi:hypothetical protein
MTDTNLNASPNAHRFDIKHLLPFLFQPKPGLTLLAAQEKPVWLTPMLVVSIMFLLRTILGGYFQAHAAALGQVALPPDWLYWSPEMQKNYLQAQSATQGPVFIYVIPAALGLVKFWLAWLIVAGLTHLSSTLFGGRGKMVSALNVVAWACLPFVVRDLLRVIYMLIVRHPIVSPGLSGLVALPFMSKFLASVDLFFLWFAILLVLGIRIADNLPVGKAVASVAIVLLIVLLAQAGLATLSTRLGGMIITRPF